MKGHSWRGIFWCLSFILTTSANFAMMLVSHYDFKHVVLAKVSQFPCFKFVIGLGRVPTRYWKYWKSIEFQNQFSRPWKSIEFGQNVH